MKRRYRAQEATSPRSERASTCRRRHGDTARSRCCGAGCRPPGPPAPRRSARLDGDALEEAASETLGRHRPVVEQSQMHHPAIGRHHRLQHGALTGPARTSAAARCARERSRSSRSSWKPSQSMRQSADSSESLVSSRGRGTCRACSASPSSSTSHSESAPSRPMSRRSPPSRMVAWKPRDRRAAGAARASAEPPARRRAAHAPARRGSPEGSSAGRATRLPCGGSARAQDGSRWKPRDATAPAWSQRRGRQGLRGPFRLLARGRHRSRHLGGQRRQELPLAARGLGLRQDLAFTQGQVLADRCGPPRGGAW